MNRLFNLNSAWHRSCAAIGAGLLVSFAPAFALAQPAPPPPGIAPATPAGAPAGAPAAVGPSLGPSALEPPPGIAPAGSPCTPGVTTNCTSAATPAANTEKQLVAGEKEDTGRTLELVWLRADVGASYMNLTSFDGKDTMGLVKTSQAGPTFSAAAGVRFVLFSLGARVRLHQFSAFNMWQVNGIAGFHIPLGNLDIALSGHGGYSFEGKLSDATSPEVTGGQPVAGSKVQVAGFNVGAGFAIDYYVSSNISIGGGITAEALFLRRPKVELPPDLPPEIRAQIENQPLYKEASSSAGFGLTGGLRLGVHFGL